MKSLLVLEQLLELSNELLVALSVLVSADPPRLGVLQRRVSHPLVGLLVASLTQRLDSARLLLTSDLALGGAKAGSRPSW